MAMNECADCNRGGQPGRLSDCLHCSRRLCPTCLAGHGRELRKQALDLHAAAVGRLAELANGEARNRERAAAVAFFDEAAAALEDRRQRVLDRLAGHGELDDLLDECGRALRAVDTDDTADSDGGRTNGADKTEAVEEEEDMEELVRLVRLLTPLSGRLAGPEGPVCCLEEAQSRLYDLIDAVDYAIEAADADGFGSLGLDFEAD
uniref:B box-type domain-containing protein n=2 Tax=Macrostomum lignano TaxID=282301 RepID=A0A1I8JA16_9PLAT